MLVLFLVPVGVSAQSSAADVQQVVIDVFQALADGDGEKIRSLVTPDFTVLEDGEIWSLDTLIVMVKKQRPTGFKRVNSFNFLRSKITNKMASVEYFNTADISWSHGHAVIRWLESAVLVKIAGKWKLYSLHSTTVSDEEKKDAGGKQ